MADIERESPFSTIERILLSHTPSDDVELQNTIRNLFISDAFTRESLDRLREEDLENFLKIMVIFSYLVEMKI